MLWFSLPSLPFLFSGLQLPWFHRFSATWQAHGWISVLALDSAGAPCLLTSEGSISPPHCSSVPFSWEPSYLKSLSHMLWLCSIHSGLFLKVSLCSPDCPKTCQAAQSGFELMTLLLPSSWQYRHFLCALTFWMYDVTIRVELHSNQVLILPQKFLYPSSLHSHNLHLNSIVIIFLDYFGIPPSPSHYYNVIACRLSVFYIKPFCEGPCFCILDKISLFPQHANHFQPYLPLS